MMREDMAIIKDIGANTIRLAHYQHDQYFYDLCDEAGMIVWAEIPYITEHLSNEITAVGGCSDDILQNHRELNDLVHKLDAIRPTTVANVFMLETDSEILDIPDILS